MSSCGVLSNAEAWKPEGFKDHLLIHELADIVGRHFKTIKRLEKKGLIPSPIHAKMGHITYRLYSPDEVAKIKVYFETSASPSPKKRRKR